MIRIFVSLGIEKVRITGGEPLLRAGVVEMVAELAQMRTAYPVGDGFDDDRSSGKLDIALTTNGHLLEQMAAPLKAAGLNRVTVSMDAVDSDTFSRITRVPRSFDRVLAGVRAARDAGLGPVKVNCVLLRGFNDDQIERFAEFSRTENVIVRFIEWMPLEEPSSLPGARNWAPETVVPMDEIISRLNAYRPLVDLAPNAASETAQALHVRRRPWRDRHYRACLAAFLWALQPDPADLGRQDSHLPVLAVRPRPGKESPRRKIRSAA